MHQPQPTSPTHTEGQLTQKAAQTQPEASTRLSLANTHTTATTQQHAQVVIRPAHTLTQPMSPPVVLQHLHDLHHLCLKASNTPSQLTLKG